MIAPPFAYTVIMPAAYTHFAVARETLVRLSPHIREKVRFPQLYFFGAQGADFCFFYRAFRPSEINFGRFLHNRGSYDFFVAMAAMAGRDERLLSYAAGYVTHYAADCVFHPFVYHLSGKSPLRHTRAEGALDYYFHRRDLALRGGAYVKSREKAETEGEKAAGGARTEESERIRRYSPYFNRTPTEDEISALYTLYASAATRADRTPLIKASFNRSVRNYFAYTAFFARTFERAHPDFLNLERGEWSYPDDAARNLTDGAEELFLRAAEDGARLTEEFFACVFDRLPVERASFGKNFLSGI